MGECGQHAVVVVVVGVDVAEEDGGYGQDGGCGGRGRVRGRGGRDVGHGCCLLTGVGTSDGGRRGDGAGRGAADAVGMDRAQRLAGGQARQRERPHVVGDLLEPGARVRHEAPVQAAELAHRPQALQIARADAGGELDLDSQAPAPAVDQNEIDLPAGSAVPPVERLGGERGPAPRGEELVDDPGLEGLPQQLRGVGDVMARADEALARARGVDRVPLGGASARPGDPPVQIGQQGDEEPALQDAEVAADGPRVEIELLRDPGSIDLAPGRMKDRVEDPAGDARVQVLRGQHPVSENGQGVRLHPVLPGGAREGQEGKGEGGKPPGLEPGPQVVGPGRRRLGGGEVGVEEDVDEARRFGVGWSLRLQAGERVQGEPRRPPGQGIGSGHRPASH